MSTFANCEDPDEMQLNVIMVFRQKNTIFLKKIIT